MSAFDAVMLIIFSLAIVAIITVDVMFCKRQQTGSMRMTLESAKEIAESVIKRVALAILTEAERTFGAGTGELKMSYCLTKLIELLPETVVEIFPKDALQDLLESALIDAKKKWLDNPRLLNKED